MEENRRGALRDESKRNGEKERPDRLQLLRFPTNMVILVLYGRPHLVQVWVALFFYIKML